MLRALIDKVDSMQEQMGNVSKEMEILKKNQKRMLEIKKKKYKKTEKAKCNSWCYEALER